MKIVDFPIKNHRLNQNGNDKKKSKQKEGLSKEEKKRLVEEFEEMVESLDDEHGKDFNFDANPDQFVAYALRFPCFASLARIDCDSILKMFEEGELTLEQTVVVELVLDLTCDIDFGFSIKEAFEVWGPGDQAAMIQLLGFHSMHIELADNGLSV